MEFYYCDIGFQICALKFKNRFQFFMVIDFINFGEHGKIIECRVTFQNIQSSSKGREWRYNSQARKN